MIAHGNITQVPDACARVWGGARLDGSGIAGTCVALDDLAPLTNVKPSGMIHAHTTDLRKFGRLGAVSPDTLSPDVATADLL